MSKENPLIQKLQERIRASGAITFRDWMAVALYDRENGYYCSPGLTRWGRQGDYRTSPERSALFSATFARYFAELYRKMASPGRWTVVEAGAGAGDFALGLLEHLQKRSPEVIRVTRYVIDEKSKDSRRVLGERLRTFDAQVEYASIGSLISINPGLVFANELLDAFPAHRVTMSEGELRELYVVLDDKGEFTWQPGPPSCERLAQHLKRPELHLAESQIAEVNLEIEDWLRLVASKLNKGYLIMIDYGSEASLLYNARSRPQGTLRSFHRHQFVNNVLANPGEQDLTTTIDWTWVREVSEKLGFRVVQFESQDQFLLGAGILDELKSMSDEMENEADRVKLRIHTREMILPEGMAQSYQVLVLSKGI